MAVPIVMPRLGDFMTEGVVAKWTRAQGQAVKQGEVIAEIESEKITYELEAAADGLFHPVVPEGATVPVDGVIGYLLAEGEAPPEPPRAEAPTPAQATTTPTAPAPTPTAPSPGPGRGAGVVPSTPGARRLAARLGVDISQVPPTGPRGRVTEADVRAYAEARQQSRAPAPTPQAPAEAPDLPPGIPTPTRVVPLRGMRKAIADHMRHSISTTAQLTFFLEADVTEAMDLRRRFSREHGRTVTTAHVFIKACAETLKRHPEHNTVLWKGSILYFDRVNIGIAVALREGLIVPVLRDADRKDLLQIAQEADDLARRAREGRLSTDDLVGGTFTISVLGSVDGFTPILNPGQNAILGVGRSVEKPAVRDGQVVVREMMTLSLTVDHQVIDGAVAAAFLRRLQQTIERPAALFRLDEG